MEVALPPFVFVFCPPDLDLSELEISLVMSLGGDVCSLGACYMLSMDRNLPSITMVSKKALCVLKLMRRILLISSLVLYHFPCISS